MMTPLMINLKYFIKFSIFLSFKSLIKKTYNYEKASFKIYLISLPAFALLFFYLLMNYNNLSLKSELNVVVMIQYD